jgi:hypothetical protein
MLILLACVFPKLRLAMSNVKLTGRSDSEAPLER